MNTDELLYGFKDFIDSVDSFTQDNQNMFELFPAMLELQTQKGNVYGRSYCKHGEPSIFMNVERKFDRISMIMERAMQEGMDTLYSGKGDTPTETFLDTVVDLANYSCLWAGFIIENHPEVWEKFLRNNRLKEYKGKTDEL